MVRAAFVNTATNDEGIYNVRFFIRGKPWIVTVDDYLLTCASGQDIGGSRLVAAGTSADGNSIWGAVLEKAWAKVKGNYVMSEGG